MPNPQITRSLLLEMGIDQEGLAALPLSSDGALIMPRMVVWYEENWNPPPPVPELMRDTVDCVRQNNGELEALLLGGVAVPVAELIATPRGESCKAQTTEPV